MLSDFYLFKTLLDQKLLLHDNKLCILMLCFPWVLGFKKPFREK
jgi:hypothetical protein